MARNMQRGKVVAVVGGGSAAVSLYRAICREPFFRLMFFFVLVDDIAAIDNQFFACE